MIIHILFGQRKEDYPEQYAPEALEVADEYAMQENPEWMQEKLAYYEGTKEFTALKVMEIEVKQGAVRSALLDPPRLESKLVDAEEGPVKVETRRESPDALTGEPIAKGEEAWWVSGVGVFREHPTPQVITEAKRRQEADATSD